MDAIWVLEAWLRELGTTGLVLLAVGIMTLLTVALYSVAGR